MIKKVEHKMEVNRTVSLVKHGSKLENLYLMVNVLMLMIVHGRSEFTFQAKVLFFLFGSLGFFLAFFCWQIKIDGQDIRKVTLKSLRKSIGVVPQDTVSCHKLSSLIFSMVPAKCVG